jgi:hypothetical protein
VQLQQVTWHQQPSTLATCVTDLLLHSGGSCYSLRTPLIVPLVQASLQLLWVIAAATTPDCDCQDSHSISSHITVLQSFYFL